MEDLYRKAEPLIGREKAKELWLRSQISPDVKRIIELKLRSLLAKQSDSAYIFTGHRDKCVFK